MIYMNDIIGLFQQFKVWLWGANFL